MNSPASISGLQVGGLLERLPACFNIIGRSNNAGSRLCGPPVTFSIRSTRLDAGGLTGRARAEGTRAVLGGGEPALIWPQRAVDLVSW